MTQAKLKSNSVVTTIIDGSEIVFTVLGAGSISFDATKCDVELRKRAEMHGWKQRISDMAALTRDTSTGLSASPEDKLAAMTVGVNHYMSGTSEWNLRASAPRISGGLLLAALCRVYPSSSREKIQAKIKSWSKEDRLSVEMSEKVKAIMDEIRAAAVSNVDVDALLGDL